MDSAEGKLFASQYMEFMVFCHIISVSLWNAHMAPQIYSLVNIKIVNVEIRITRFYSPTFHLSQLFSSLLSVKDIKTKGAKIIPLGGVMIDKEIDWLFRNFCPSNGTCSV
ncbi:hypothetical protein PcaKH35_31870 [Parageobacillus caldoxylosilyticus]|nr:hypothetical protein PcaKH35_31870 [Parageobacillus caldoxylosilyticus]